VVAGALAAIVVIYVPMAGTQAFDSSQKMVRAGDLEGALAKAERSSDLLPWAASPLIQRAQILQLLGRRPQAIERARKAVEREGVNWRNWLVYSQVLDGGFPDLSRRALRKALELNPRSQYLRGLVRQLDEP
jgi:tetratricopeptide (TPR) repeat protein